MSLPREEGEGDQNWLRNFKKFARSAPPKPIFVGKVKMPCPNCTFEAAIELFRDGKCLACQAADFIGPIKKISPT